VPDERRRVSMGRTIYYANTYNARGEREEKSLTNGMTVQRFIYDEAGRLIQTGNVPPVGLTRTLKPEQRLLWLADQLVGVKIKATSGAYAGEPLYAHTDHLGTPRALSCASNNSTVWRWALETSVFGQHPAQSDPDGDGQVLTFNLRYPGQYFDSESGLHYNYFRDYEPATGRYIESDPIGIFGGINTFAYAASQPLLLIDPTGESYATAVGGWIAADGAVPEPSDAAWPKWAGYALAFGGALALDYCLDRSDEDACEKEWREARERCRQLIYEQMQQAAGRRKKRKVTGVTGGYTDVEQCARGLVSERCGGNRVSY